MGIPGWPEFAACTASMANARNALVSSLLIYGEQSEGVGSTFIIIGESRLLGEYATNRGVASTAPLIAGSTMGRVIRHRMYSYLEEQ